MHEVTGPIVAIVLTLTAVFVPIAFLGGLTGELYRQFAVTISIAVVISGLVALTLTPALSALILRHNPPPKRGFFALFNRFFTSVTTPLLRRRRLDDPPRHRRVSILFVGMVVITARALAHHAGQPRSRRGSGLVLRVGDPARRRVAAAHRQGRERRSRRSSVRIPPTRT